MSVKSMTRRHFLEGSLGGVAALTVAGITSSAAMDDAQAFAQIGDITQTEQVNTLCQGCLNQCGCTAYNVNGEFDKMLPDTANEAAAGSLCARGYAYTQSAFSENNLKKPLKRLSSGRYDELGWDKALSEIADSINSIKENSGAGALAMIYAPSATNSFYGPYLMNSLESSNVFVDDVIYNASKAAGFKQVIGVDSYTPDIARAELIVLIDTSYADIERPGMVDALQKAKESGAQIIAIDSRYATLASMADQWISIRPGTELALLLAVCNFIIKNAGYDKDYIAQNSVGFDVWKDAISGYTTDWAAGICGITSTEIETLAAALIQAAPKVAIEYGNYKIATGAYANSGETARIVCLLNSLLATWNQPGGALLPFDWTGLEAASVSPAANSDNALPLKSVFAPDTYALATPEGNSMALALERIKTHDIKGLITLDANIAADYAFADLTEALADLELFVVIARQMTETAELADYVLPECSYLECSSLPNLMDGVSPQVSLQTKAVTFSDTEALSGADILCAIGEACDCLSDYEVPIQGITEAQLLSMGLSTDALQSGGTATLRDVVSRIDTWMTPTGKIQFFSDECAQAGLSGCPLWVDPYEFTDEESKEIAKGDLAGNEPDTNVDHASFDTEYEDVAEAEASASDEEGVTLRLITGEQTAVGSDSADVARLMDIATKYSLFNAWINSETAEALGVETGDEIVITSNNASDVVPVTVTKRINRNAVFLPRFFGRGAAVLGDEVGVGINPMMFVEGQAEAGYGSICNLGTCVTVQKSGV